MGNVCGGSPETPEQKAARMRAVAGTKNIDAILVRENRAEEQVKKLLLLGAGESGKSTLFKQMIILYGNQYSDDDRKTYRNIVFNNTIAAMRTLVEMSDIMAEELQTVETKISSDNLDAKRAVSAMRTDGEVDEQAAEQIGRLWKDKGIRETYKLRNRFQLADSAAYFFGRLEAMCQPDFIPDQQDVLRARVRTTGIVETEFTIDENNFKMFDVGGQRNERKKWIHCFENVTAVIFVAAISEYDQVLYEDESTNRMEEALNLFDEICNSRWFRETSIILFLNKRDLFVEKIARVPLTEYFPDYDGASASKNGENVQEAYDDGCDFIQEKFEQKNRSDDKEIYTHVTCATDTEQVEHVFDAVKDIIIRQSLREGGLLD